MDKYLLAWVLSQSRYSDHFVPRHGPCCSGVPTTTSHSPYRHSLSCLKRASSLTAFPQQTYISALPTPHARSHFRKPDI